MNERNKLTKKAFKKLQPEITISARAHKARKMDKIYESIPAFCPRIDIVGVTHYSLVKYLSVLFNLLMQNIYTLKDSFDQNEKITTFYA